MQADIELFDYNAERRFFRSHTTTTTTKYFDEAAHLSTQHMPSRMQRYKAELAFPPERLRSDLERDLRRRSKTMF